MPEDEEPRSELLVHISAICTLSNDARYKKQFHNFFTFRPVRDPPPHHNEGPDHASHYATAAFQAQDPYAGGIINVLDKSFVSDSHKGSQHGAGSLQRSQHLTTVDDASEHRNETWPDPDLRQYHRSLPAKAKASLVAASPTLLVNRTPWDTKMTTGRSGIVLETPHGQQNAPEENEMGSTRTPPSVVPDSQETPRPILKRCRDSDQTDTSSSFKIQNSSPTIKRMKMDRFIGNPMSPDRPSGVGPAEQSGVPETTKSSTSIVSNASGSLVHVRLDDLPLNNRKNQPASSALSSAPSDQGNYRSASAPAIRQVSHESAIDKLRPLMPGSIESSEQSRPISPMAGSFSAPEPYQNVHRPNDISLRLSPISTSVLTSGMPGILRSTSPHRSLPPSALLPAIPSRRTRPESSLGHEADLNLDSESDSPTTPFLVVTRPTIHSSSLRVEKEVYPAEYEKCFWSGSSPLLLAPLATEPSEAAVQAARILACPAPRQTDTAPKPLNCEHHPGSSLVTTSTVHEATNSRKMLQRNLPAGARKVIPWPEQRVGNEPWVTYLTPILRNMNDIPYGSPKLSTFYRPDPITNEISKHARGWWQFRITDESRQDIDISWPAAPSSTWPLDHIDPWTATDRDKFWDYLGRMIGSGHLGNIWVEQFPRGDICCNRRPEEELDQPKIMRSGTSQGRPRGRREGQEARPDQRDLVRVYCWGECVKEVWLMLVLGSKKIMATKCEWVKATGELCITLPVQSYPRTEHNTRV